jgi:hypothetical protein
MYKHNQLNFKKVQILIFLVMILEIGIDGFAQIAIVVQELLAKCEI